MAYLLILGYNHKNSPVVKYVTLTDTTHLCLNTNYIRGNKGPLLTPVRGFCFLCTMVANNKEIVVKLLTLHLTDSYVLESIMFMLHPSEHCRAVEQPLLKFHLTSTTTII